MVGAAVQLGRVRALGLSFRPFRPFAAQVRAWAARARPATPARPLKTAGRPIGQQKPLDQPTEPPCAPIKSTFE